MRIWTVQIDTGLSPINFSFFFSIFSLEVVWVISIVENGVINSRIVNDVFKLVKALFSPFKFVTGVTLVAPVHVFVNASTVVNTDTILYHHTIDLGLTCTAFRTASFKLVNFIANIVASGTLGFSVDVACVVGDDITFITSADVFFASVSGGIITFQMVEIVTRSATWLVMNRAVSVV